MNKIALLLVLISAFFVAGCRKAEVSPETVAEMPHLSPQSNGMAGGVWQISYGEDIGSERSVLPPMFLDISDDNGIISGKEALGTTTINGARTGNQIQFYCKLQSSRMETSGAWEVWSLNFSGVVSGNSMSGTLAVANVSNPDDYALADNNGTITTTWAASKQGQH
jgi:hypothetical protein